MPANPVSTYRFQFHKEFTFNDFERIIPYLRKLGVKTVYASPVFTATPGSTHGYDSLNPHEINPEIGTEDQLKALSKQLRSQGVEWLQDIVPNHMAFSPDNPWIFDLLEKGPQSVYASFFDTALSSDLYNGRVMVPFLGSSIEEVIKNGEFRIEFREGRFVFNYFDNIYPLNPGSYSTIIRGKEDISEGLEQLLAQMQQIHQVEDAKLYADSWNEFLLQLTSLMKNEEIATYINKRIAEVNEDREQLHQLAEMQVYRLCSWQETDYKITFRRFFTVNGLICLNIQNKDVFDTYHQYIRALLDEGVFTGLRVDHVDGLFDPSGYLENLRELAGDDTYIVVEKILEPGEDIPQGWPLQGNTGYDFLALLNNLFTNKDNEKHFNRFYSNLAGDESDVQQQIYTKKAYILYEHMRGELDNLHRLLIESALIGKNDKSQQAGIKDDDLKSAIGELLVQCPVYRYYGNQFPLEKEEEDAVRMILSRIPKEKPELTGAVKLLEKVLLDKPKEGNDEYNKKALYFYQRCMQFSGPLMAKGVEDTLMYTYNRFVAHNEVGDSPEAFGISPADFHNKMVQRQQNWPLSINATSTHDTKRGEDVRARLNVLSDIPEEWFQKVEEWMELARSLKKNDAPDPNDEYLIYQTLLGAYPMPGQGEDNFKERIQNYIEKALREAKVNSNWTEPDADYEDAAKNFALKLLGNEKFINSFGPFHHDVADLGIVNSLAQTILKFTCPGVPDTYQGCDLWDLSLVDPDNRRPVDYELRTQMLDELEVKDQNDDLVQWLWQKRHQGHIKLWMTQKLLKERAAHADVFSKGQYLPVKIKGKYKDQLFAFARIFKDNCYITVVPLHLAQICREQNAGITEIDWKNTRIILPDGIPEKWSHILIRNVEGKAKEEIMVQEIFGQLPVAILKLERKITERGAGILMHISSLPSPFGTGDFGPEARNFAGFLSRSKQKYWQLLPLSPTEEGSGYSPYSSYSSMAGNPLLISPELLVLDGLLSQKKLDEYALPVKAKADFRRAGKLRDVLFEKAYRKFIKGDFGKLKREFATFCKHESAWLDDFSKYIVLKQQHNGTAWYQWPEKYKLRDPAALEAFAAENADALEKTKFLQFVFIRQWNDLKDYCNNLGIQMFGDMPFYVSYDSADVWANPGIFCLDREGNMTGVAGVPPDYFNENGQLWGMPVFRWDILKKQGYAWWIRRIQKNIELFDLLRFDHFRAFSAYWEVPASEETAKNGVWKPGPGKDFFKAIQKAFGKLPFIAEDLGDIDAPVYELRDSFGLPGMKVLQFAFGDDMPQAIAIPHQYTPNFFVYTGTHDNNTTRGWFDKDADETILTNLNDYTGQAVKSKNVHQVLARMAYASVAKAAIIPLQDVLGLDEKSRMNSPASAQGNWLWRLEPNQLGSKEEETLKNWTRIYGRD